MLEDDCTTGRRPSCCPESEIECLEYERMLTSASLFIICSGLRISHILGMKGYHSLQKLIH